MQTSRYPYCIKNKSNFMRTGGHMDKVHLVAAALYRTRITNPER